MSTFLKFVGVVMAKWHSTRYPGIRFREHSARKHGIQKDKYFVIRYQRDNKRTEEGLGWASQGWTLQKANARLSEIKENQRIGQGPQSLSEQRALKKARREKEQADKKRLDKENVSFSFYFENTYCPAQINKNAVSIKSELNYYKKWIKPVFKKLPFKDIGPFDCERIKKNMIKAGRAPRTLQYCFATVRQTWNMARRDGLVSSESPTKGVKIPKINNKRLRFLTHDESDILLKELAKRSVQLHDEALLSLHCGLRAGEIFSLEWSDVDLEHGLLALRDAKAGDRTAYMTEAVKNMLAGRKPSAKNRLIFFDRDGTKIKRISNSFARAVDAVNLNDHITDKRQRLVFHTLRHTFASWHVQAGTDLYSLQTLLGHQSFSMVQRYAHLSEGALQKAVKIA
jgi:site-specific recombinase XerD